VAVLARLPVQAAYNLTIVDREGDAVTAHVGPDHAADIGRALVATNHQRTVDWPEHAEAVRSEQREQCMLDLLATRPEEDAFVAAFLEPPLYSTGNGFATLYTAVYRPLDGAVDYRWPDATWRQAIDAFDEGSLSRSRSSRA
jgi:predicted choloylglycine hydrolase